jgi:hypothetical protein
LVGRPPALGRLDGRDGAVRVVEVHEGAVVGAEVELRELAVQVLLRAVLVDAPHPALEDREHALDGAGVDLSADVVLAGRVPDRLARRELGPDLG